MEKEIFLKYLEVALSNLNVSKAMKFNVEGEVIRLFNAYSKEEINEKIKDISFKKGH